LRWRNMQGQGRATSSQGWALKKTRGAG